MKTLSVMTSDKYKGNSFESGQPPKLQVDGKMNHKDSRSLTVPA